uniref:DB domain-containing protein n=1 Tax=Syphacia muris TaxID=451379 RepID=A0A0N5AA48_9BILA
MLPKGLFKLCLLVSLYLNVNADLPSCERVKCHHCNIKFIAEKCPEICKICENRHNPEQKRTQQPTYVVAAQQTHELRQDGNSGLLRPISDSESPSQTTSLKYQGPQTLQIKLKAVYSSEEMQPTQQQFLSENIQTPYLTQQNPASAAQPNSIQLPASSPTTNPYQLTPQQQYAAPQSQNMQPLPYLTAKIQTQQPTATNQQQQQPASSPITLQQTPAFNPFQPFLTQTFNAIPGMNISPLFANPYTPFPLPTIAPVTLPPLQYAQNVPQQQPTYQPYPNQQHTNQYYQYPINDGHPSVLQKPQSVSAASNHITKPTSQTQITYPEPVKYGLQKVQSQENSFTQQISTGQTVVTQPQTQTLYAKKKQTTSITKPANTVVTPKKPIEKKVETVSSEYPNIQTSIDGPKCPRQPNWQPCISKQVANDRFRNCCLRLGEGCSSLCSYDSTLATIQLSVLTGRCPLSKVGEMMVCASGYEDATPCCEAHNVFEPGYEHCKPYCNPAAGLPQGGMLAEKFKCLGKLSQIQRCFYVTQRP